MRLIITGVLLLCGTLHPIISAAAQTQWISDKLPLDMRSGPSNEYRIIKMLAPGTPITVIAVDEQAQFSEVVTEEGTKGWLTNRYLMNEPSAREQLDQAKSAIAKLRTGKEPLQERLTELEKETNSLSAQLAEATTQRDDAVKQLNHIKEVSANAIDLDNSNQSLMEANQLLQHEIDVLQGENSRLSDNSSSAWFIKGALAVGLGALLTLAIPHVTPSRKNREWR